MKLRLSLAAALFRLGVGLGLAVTVAAPLRADAGRSEAPLDGFERLQRLDLPSGLRVLVARPTRAALFSEALLVVRAGTGTVASGQEEIARIAAAGLTAGRMPAEGPPVRLQLARMGVTLDSTVGREVAIFRFAVPTRKTLPFLHLLSGLLARTSLPEEVWGEAVARRGEELAHEQADSWQRAVSQLTSLAWSDRPPAAATPLAPAALAAFRAAAYAPDRMVLSIWGELPIETLADAARQELAALPAPKPSGGEATPVLAGAAPAEPARRTGGGVNCLRVEGAQPAALVVGVGAAVEDDLGFYGWQVISHILAASLDSRLQSRLRAENQAIYTIDAACVPVGNRGLTLRIACQTDQVEATRKAILAELRRLTQEPVTQEELDQARAILRSRLQLDRGSFRDRLYRVSLGLLALPGLRDPAAAEPVLASLTPAGLLDLLRRTLRPDDAVTVVVSATPEPLCAAATGSGEGEQHGH
jgi:predicted Zn-dependent peptidase